MLKKLKDIFIYKWKVKLGSLMLAILFHYYVIYTKTVSKTFYISIEQPSIPNNLVFLEDPPSFMKVIFSGPEEIMDINQSNFKIRLINTSPTAGINTYKVELIPNPPSGIIAIPEKTEIEITLDRKRTKLLPVVPVVSLPENKKITYWELKPSEIKLEGPRKVFLGVDRISLLKVDLHNKNNIFFDKVLIGNLPKFVKVSENQPIEIQILLKFFSEEELQEKIKNLSTELQVFSEELDVLCSNPIDNLELEKIPKVTVTYIAKNKIPLQMFLAQVLCVVEYNNTTKNIEPNSFIPSVPVNLKVNEIYKDIEILKVEPLTVDLNFKIKSAPPVKQIQKGLQEHLKPN